MTVQPVDVVAQMEALVTRWQAASDRRAIFLDCYLVMTRNMQRALEDGEFQDPRWVAALLQRFATYYFAALAVYETDPDATPAVWRQTHAAAGETRTHVLQNLVLGINAHINYDLVLALYDLLAEEWPGCSAEQQQSRYADHCRVNAIIGRSIDLVQDEVVEREDGRLDIVDRLFGPLDEWAASRLIAHWREGVWEGTQRLLQAGTPDAREQVRRQVEAAALRRANLILLGGRNIGEWWSW
jgi:hypothetical protein